MVEIEYDKNSVVLACIVLGHRCTHPWFKWDYIELNGETFKNNEPEERITKTDGGRIIEVFWDWDEVGFVKKNFDKMLTTNKILIKSKTREDWMFAREILIYKTTSDYEDEYYFLKELRRWDEEGDVP